MNGPLCRWVSVEFVMLRNCHSVTEEEAGTNSPPVPAS